MSSLEKLLPENISDETAVVVSDLLNELFCLWDSKYYAQMHRYYQAQEDTSRDPERPWESVHPKSNEELVEFNDEIPF